MLRDRVASDIHSGLYVVPGGQTERGERGVDCVVREFEQETGLTLVNPRLRAIVTFYNEGRLLGGRLNPDDWCVEVYTANSFTGSLKPESPQQLPIWVDSSNIPNLKMHEGDRRILELLNMEGVYETIVRYEGTKLTTFESRRVA